MKLQKFLQEIGVDNRRNIRKFINEGKFKVNNNTIKDPNFIINKDKDVILFQNKKINLKIKEKVYFIFNKPIGVISSLHDPQNRVTIKDFIGKIKERVYPVGRLDFNSEGLLLLTNDGELTNFIISPRNRIPKIYLIKIKGDMSPKKAKTIQTKGIYLEGKTVRPQRIEIIKTTAKGNSWLRISIIEGKKHILRKVFQYHGHPVLKLKRIAIGNLKLKKVPKGHWRELKIEEIEDFRKKYHYFEK